MGGGFSCTGKASVNVADKFKTDAEMTMNILPKQNNVGTTEKVETTDKQEKENKE